MDGFGDDSGSHSQSQHTGDPSQFSQVASHPRPTYRQNKETPPNTGRMVPLHPTSGPFSGGFSPSPTESAHPTTPNGPERVQTQSWTAINGTTVNTDGRVAQSDQAHEARSHLRTPDNDVGAVTGTYRQKQVPAGRDPTSAAAFALTSAPRPTVSLSKTKRRPRYSLKKLAHLDGELTVIPPELLRNLQEIARANKNSLLLFAKLIWAPRTNTSQTFADGASRKWLAYPGAEEIKVSRFKYGALHQIIVAQAAQGSRWENGNAVVLSFGGNAGTVTAGTSATMWKVWRGQQLEEAPSVRCVRRDPAPPGRRQNPSSPSAGHFSNAAPDYRFVNTTQTPADLDTQANGRGTDLAAGMAAADQRAKRGYESSSSLDSDTPIATQKRRRPVAANHVSTPTGPSVQPSPELGSSGIDQAPAQSTPVVAPTVSPRTGSTTGNAIQATPATTPNRDPAPSPQLARQAVIEIKDEDEPPTPEVPFDIDSVKFKFINSHGAVNKEYPFKSCGTVIRLFRAANGARIINEDIEKLTITIKGAVREVELDVMREFEENFEEMKQAIVNFRANEVRVVRGTKKVDGENVKAEY